MSSSVNEDGIEVVTLSDSEDEPAGAKAPEISVEEPDAMSTSDASSPLLPSESDESEEESDEESDSTSEDEDTIDQAEGLKKKGNDHFKEQRYEHAVRMYTEAIEVVQGVKGAASLAQIAAGDEIVKSCLLNRAASNLKLKKPEQTNTDCDQVLDLDPSSVKALFRKGQALSQMATKPNVGNLKPALLKEAKATLRAAAKIEPNNKQVRSALREVLAKMDSSPTKGDSPPEDAAEAERLKKQQKDEEKRRLDAARREGERLAAQQKAAQKKAREAAARRARAMEQRTAREAEAARLRKAEAAREQEAARLRKAQLARDAIRFKYLSQSCLNELKPGRPASPPIPEDKRTQGRKRVRFYNNTPDDVDLFFMKQNVPKKMFDIRSGNKSGSYAMQGSKFHAESLDRSKKYGPWIVDGSSEKQVYFLIDPEPKPAPSARPAAAPRPAWGTSAAADTDDDDDLDSSSEEDDDDEEEDDDDESEEEENDETYRTADEAKAAGNRFIGRGDFTEAKQCYTRAIALDGTVAAYYGNRAQCHLRLNSFSEALADSVKSTELDSKFGKGWIRTGVCHVRLGNFDDATKCFQTAMKIRVPPMGTLQYADMAKSELRQLQSIQKVLPRIAELVEEDEAISYKEAERMSQGIWKDKCPGHLELTLHYLKALIANRKWDDVKRVSQQAMGFHGQTPNLVTMRGQCLLYMGQIPSAKQCFQKVLREDPDYKPAQVLLKNILKVDRAKLAANELYKEGKYEDAKDGYTEAINIDKLNAAVTSKLYCNRANCCVKLEQWEEAASDAGEAIARNETYGKAFALRGQARMTLENYDDACKDYSRASELEPDSTAFKDSLKQAKNLRAKEERRSLYDLLNISRDAAGSQVKKGYHKAALVWHPDKHSDKGPEGQKVAEHRFKAIGEAYGILSDPTKKRRYDNGVPKDKCDDDSSDYGGYGGGGFGGFGGGGFGGGGYGGRRSSGFRRR